MRKNEDAMTLKELYPEMIEKEWHYYYNGLLGLDPETILSHYYQQVYWTCPNCSSTYRMSPKNRCQNKVRNKESCFCCRGRVQLHAFTVNL